MENSTDDMVLVYDSKRREHSAFSEGQIIRLYFLPYEGDHMFEVNDGERRSSWPRPGDCDWFVVGRRARVEHTRGQHPEVLRIWIGDVA